MLIGIPKEIKAHEYRVSLTPPSVRELISQGHQVLVQTGAGDGIGFHDQSYLDVGAKISNSAKEVFEKADFIVKVKEPQPEECKLLREGQILFTFLHLAADPIQAKGLMDSKCVAIAYETVTDSNGTLPLLIPMSEVAGRMSIQAGARCLEKFKGGNGVLLGGVPGVEAGKVVIIGGGVVGTNAARMAMGLEAQVTILEKSLHRLRELNLQFGSRLETVYSTVTSIDEHVSKADLVIGAILIPGSAAPKIITKAHVKNMRPGSVFVDVAIDQGGCSETSRPTTHDDPIYTVDEVIHYCVTNMPGSVARTSASALNNATLPYICKLANEGYKQALLGNHYFCEGLNVAFGHITHKAVADDLGYTYVSPEKAFEAA
ncbi:MAG: alanine dehydrogenase [Alphaproteobacteria bacterium]|jgi:alanine dehydrogenase|nr:alanine dehydrogenase [Alphaproteobacteria bacterium]MBT5389791.1 alanine dehydrogenase [Alphaproteobacteria bacterium]MBT5540117.1 alanine dehydrogenase [Alphaproteobacteria bacterium]MBT5655043.1 alanine dehydrogenase [Alphaproteobacteria bacterium]